MLGQIYVMYSNGYYYVGKHDGDIFKDNYYGSGIAWNNVINKYGKDCVERNVICTYDTKADGDRLEIAYIKEYREKIGEKCLNIANGGQGGNLGEEVNKRISESVSGDKNGMYGKTLSEDSRKKISDRLKEINHKPNKGKKFDDGWKAHLSESHSGENAFWLGKHHSEESKEKIRQARKNQKNLNLTSAKGKHWFTNGVDSKMFFDGEQPDGWVRGRVYKEGAYEKNIS